MKRFSLLRLLPIWLAMVALAGCTPEEDGQSKTSSGNRTFTLHYSFDDVHTRATAATGDEKVIKNVYLIFYKEDAENPAGQTYVTYQSATLPEGGLSTGSFAFVVPAEIEEGEKYKVLIVGNYDTFKPGNQDIGDYIAANTTKTYTAMQQDIYAQAAVPTGSSQTYQRITTPLPFYGILLGADGTESSFTGPAKTDTSLGVSIRFSRAVARFDVRHMAADKLKIAWVKVCNYRSRGYLFHSDAPAGDIVAGTASSLPAKLPAGYVAVADPVGKLQSVSGGLYAFPNIVSYAAQNDKVTTYLMIAGYYQTAGEPANDSKLTYYRANIADNGKSQVLKRNYLYTVAINNVSKEGSDTEEGAASEGEKLLDYGVDDAWEDDDSNTATDSKGNFLTVSRTSVVMESPAGEAALIKVSVKEGTSWSVDWEQNGDNAFSYEKVDDKTFRILTTGNNSTPFTNTARLRVTAKGGTISASAPLELTVNVTQLSSSNDPQILMVEGKTTDFSYTVAGQGSSVSLQVLTGGATSQWKIEADNNLSQMVGSFVSKGAHKAYIQLDFQPNTTASARSGVLTVSRLLTDGTTVDPDIKPIKITFSQEKSQYLVTVSPNYSENGLVIEGFSSATGNVNGVSVNKRFQVLLADPANYTFKVESSFNKNTDAFITVSAPSTSIAATAHRTENSYTKATGTGISGNSFYLNVFRTGPGDADLKGTINVTAVPKATGGVTQTFSFTVTIKSSCKLGEVAIGKLLIADRNVGAVSKIEANAALNYTADANHDDNLGSHLLFKGLTYSRVTGEAACRDAFGPDNYEEGEYATGWRSPAYYTELQTFSTKMLFSKRRAFLLSDDKTTGCFFPLSSSTTSIDLAGGYYITNNIPYSSAYYYMWVSPSSALTYASNIEGVLRCVRDIK